VVTSTPTKPVFGQTVNFTATVKSTSGVGIPTGSVTFVVDNINRGTLPLDSAGKAVVPVSGLAVGSHTVVVQYSGDDFFAASSVSTIKKVLPGQTRVKLQGPTLAKFNTPLTFTAAAIVLSPASGIPSGTMQFFVDGQLKASVQLDGS